MKKDLQKKKPQLLGGAIALVLLGFTAGCGSSGADPSSGMSGDEQSIDNLVRSIADDANDVTRLRELFTKESAPSSSLARKFKQCNFELDYDSEIAISGDTATLNVRVFTYDDPPTETVKSWKAQKVGGTWKLSDTPL